MILASEVAMQHLILYYFDIFSTLSAFKSALFQRHFLKLVFEAARYLLRYIKISAIFVYYSALFNCGVIQVCLILTLSQITT